MFRNPIITLNTEAAVNGHNSQRFCLLLCHIWSALVATKNSHKKPNRIFNTTAATTVVAILGSRPKPKSTTN